MRENFLRMITLIIIIFSCLSYNQETFMVTTGETLVGIALCSDPSTLYTNSSQDLQENFGHHSWIAVTNMGKSQLKINGIIIPFSKTITIGTWHGAIHDGIYYNYERYYAMKNEFSLVESVYKIQILDDFQFNFFLKELNKIANDTWNLYNNCSSFAVDLWNINAKNKISAGLIPCPKTLAKNILKEGRKKRINYFL